MKMSAWIQKSVMTCMTVVAVSLALPAACAQQSPERVIPQSDTSFIDSEGTAHVTRVVPVPTTISPEAQKVVARQMSDSPPPESVAENRARTDAWQTRAGAESRAIYPVNIASDTIAGIPVRIVTPLAIAPDKANWVLINVHGGGFVVDSGSLTETIPLANLTRTKVVAVLYRLAPEHPFPAAVDDTVAVYKELLKTYPPNNIGLYGTSAGAILTGEVVSKLRQLNLPLPAALGIFSGLGDLSQHSDSAAIFGLSGLSGPLHPPKDLPVPEYVASTNPRDPVLSPLYADLRGLPPTLFITSTRDLLLSGTSILHRAFLKAGVDAQLVVFEGLAHAFWNNPGLPESKDADQLMADFFAKHLGK
jgi:monoterpene epsilon-lactone hydrolase